MKISSLERIYISSPIEIAKEIQLTPDQTHYLTSVMRCKIGWQLRIFNETSGEFIAKISSISKKSCGLQVLELFRAPIGMNRLCLAQSIIKPDRMMTALSMATQLGATDIAPIITERTQTKTINHERTMRVLLENTEQCERFSIPMLHEPQTLEEFVRGGDFDSLIYANENEADLPSGLTRRSQELRETIASSAREKIAILIGPEGGFTDAELDYLSKCPKAHSVSLGATVLRSETAAVALASLVQMLR
jgi:16S rRNA (uracil1498-N3)-methyltransferase